MLRAAQVPVSCTDVFRDMTLVLRQIFVHEQSRELASSSACFLLFLPAQEPSNVQTGRRPPSPSWNNPSRCHAHRPSSLEIVDSTSRIVLARVNRVVIQRGSGAFFLNQVAIYDTCELYATRARFHRLACDVLCTSSMLFRGLHSRAGKRSEMFTDFWEAEQLLGVELRFHLPPSSSMCLFRQPRCTCGISFSTHSLHDGLFSVKYFLFCCPTTALPWQAHFPLVRTFVSEGIRSQRVLIGIDSRILLGAVAKGWCSSSTTSSKSSSAGGRAGDSRTEQLPTDIQRSSASYWNRYRSTPPRVPTTTLAGTRRGTKP